MTTRRFPVTGILFDCDGVLVDSLEPAAIAWDAWAARYSPGYDFRSQIEHGVRAADTVARLVASDVFDEAVAALEDEEVLGSAATLPIPGAVELTTSIPLGRWAVATSAARRLALARLSAAGHPSPSALIAADDVAHGKPHPEPYLRGAEALGVPASACAVFEDAPAGVRAARAAGAGLVVGVGDHLEGEVVDVHVDDLTSVSYEDGALLIRPADASAGTAA